MKRYFDLMIALVVIFILCVPIVIVTILVFSTSKGSILFWSNRVGKNGKIFSMPKFRSMRIDAPEIASHLLNNPDKWVTPFGGFLRRSSLDELPQLWSILKGDMSFVGPRPALYNQSDLIKLRKDAGITKLLPGLTGWAQVNGRDELTISDKVKFDLEYLNKQSLSFDIYILWLTFIRVLKKDGISH